MTPDILVELGEALDRRDMDLAMSYFTDDCVYYPSSGVSTREAYLGRDEVRAGLSAFLENSQTGRFELVQLVVAGDQGFEEWRFVGTDANGNPIEVHGCDYYEFRGNKVTVKNCFRKVP
jgi:ketosteroid isomerase-like protein